MQNREQQRYPFTDATTADAALDTYKKMYANLVDMAMTDFDDANDPSGSFRAGALQSKRTVERIGTHGEDKTEAAYSVLRTMFKLCERALAQRGLSMESRLSYESMAYTYASACSYCW